MKTPITKTLMAIALVAMATFFVGCGPDEPDNPTPPTPTTVAVTGVSLNKSSMTLTEGGSETLTASVAPSNATNTGVSWSSSNTGVATVNGGQVTAVKAGTATITVTTSDGGKTATCSVTVEAKKVAVTGVKFDIEALELTEGETGTIKVTVEPADATDKKVNWTSSNPEVVTVADGVVTAVAPGTATIIATTADGGKTVTCNVTINPKPVPVEDVSVEIEAIEVAEGENASIVVKITPDDATVKDVTFSSSDEAVATVDENGNITAVGPGTATITITTADGGKTATCEVTVNPKVVPVEDIAFTKDQVSVIEGEKALLYVSFTPKNASDKRVTWSSSDTGVATIDTKGNVTGVKPGTATITVKTTDGGKTATCEVTVTKKPTPVSGVTVNRTSLTLTIEGSAILVATVSPEDAANKKVVWSSSDESIVKVDQNGEVTAVKTGTAKVTATTEDGGKTATCTVTVTDKAVPATGVTLNKTTLKLNVGKSEQLAATVKPSDATNHEVTWSSSKTSVATVDKAGKVTGVAPGSATITAKTHNGKTATCTVTVVRYVESIKITNSSGTELTLPRVTWYGGSSSNSYQFKAVVSPSDAQNKEVTWSSSNTSVATIDQNGKATYKSPGTTTIKATAKDGSGVSKSITFIIYEGIANSITLKSTGGTGSFQTRVNGTFTVTATLSVDNRWTPLVNEVVWSLSSTSCARIKSYTATTCVIEGLAATTASNPVILTAKAKSGSATKSQQIAILNPPYIKSISLPSSITVTKGSTKVITPTITPANGDVMELSWSCSNTSVAKITKLSSGNLSVSGLSTGTATITCTAPVTGATATTTVRVSAAPVAVTGISFGSTIPLGIYDGGPSQTTTMSYTITPSNATNKAVNWSSSAPSIASVDSNGKIKGLKAGEATITVTTVDGGYYATRKVIVRHFTPITSIVINPSTFTIRLNQTLGIDTYTIYPSDATIQYLDWTSSDPSTVEIVQNSTSSSSNPPYIKGKKIGTVTLTAKARDGSGKSATCRVTVTN
ncbi:MAG: Ig-like domain-containing protein [Bacteroidales bacterium]|nr:Ig-like domain-containing protein [Bacteroidales bacterium]